METKSLESKTTRSKNSVSETGHSINIANFQTLIAYCISYGAKYNPSKTSLKILQLEATYQMANSKYQQVIAKKSLLNIAANNRRNTFSGLQVLSTQIVNAFAVSGANKLALANLQTINKKIQGKSAKTNSSDKETPKISTAQLSYASKIDHFSSLLEILKQNPGYTPNETELQIPALENKLAQLHATNIHYINAFTSYSNALIDRNSQLYHPETGVLQTVKEVKQYIKSIFSAKSPQFAQITSLSFKELK